VDVAEQLGVDAIGLNHLMYSTPEEVDETVRLLGTGDASSISTFVTTDPGLDPERVRRQVDRLAARCRERGVRFDMRPKVKGSILEPYYTPGSAIEGRCLYPFLYARVSFSGKAYFCPFIRIEVGDLTTQSLEEVWTGEPYVALRRRLVENGIFPVCRRCCKVELTPTADGTVSVAEEPLAETLISQ
jgi:MoaA/NifB/PqqE/SkfB family radical SAM enzyme